MDKAAQEVDGWLRGQAERVIETSCARIYLAGEFAWKVKRPVDLGFLDFTTLEKRRWALERELAFNAATAPDIYRRVRTVVRDGQELAFGDGEPVEHVLEMRRFDESAVLDAQPGAVDGTLAEDLGRTIARFHAAAPVVETGGAGALGYTIGSNAEHLRALAARLGPELVERVIGATQAAFERASPLLEERRRQGFSRRCHGDLHLGNILLENGRPVLFDCIEFNDRLSEIDVLYDVAFLLMDLQFRGRADAASRVLSAWLDEAARNFPEAIWSGLSLLPLMLATRAVVRCHVRAHAGDDQGARAYLEAAARHLEPAPAVLAAVGGLSGSGKSTLARSLAPHLSAIVLRSDEVRKRLWGASPLERLPKDAYREDESERVYGRMLREAELALRAGASVVVDAVFLNAAERQAAGALAAHCGVRFEGVWLEAPPEVLKARVGARTGDASDADVAVLETQLSRDPGEVSWRRETDHARAIAALVSHLRD